MMPPPMTTICGVGGQCHAGRLSVCRAVGVERGVEPRQVLGRVGDIVGAGRREVQFRDHAPHRFAQQRGALHGRVGAANFLVRLAPEIGGEQSRRIPSPLMSGIRRRAGQIEHRGVEAGIFEIDQPELPSPSSRKLAGRRSLWPNTIGSGFCACSSSSAKRQIARQAPPSCGCRRPEACGHSRG